MDMNCYELIDPAKYEFAYLLLLVRNYCLIYLSLILFIKGMKNVLLVMRLNKIYIKFGWNGLLLCNKKDIKDGPYYVGNYFLWM
jgi:hypothetical protein